MVVAYVKELVYGLVGVAIIGGALIKIGIEQIKNTSQSVGGTEGTVMGIGSIVLAAGFILAVLGTFMK